MNIFGQSAIHFISHTLFSFQGVPELGSTHQRAAFLLCDDLCIIEAVGASYSTIDII